MKVVHGKSSKGRKEADIGVRFPSREDTFLRRVEHRPILRGAWADSPWSVSRCSVERKPILRGA